MRKFEGRGVKRSELFHTSRFTLQTSRSSGGRTRTFTRLRNREPPCHWATPDCFSAEVRMAGFEPAISCFRNTRDTRLPHVLIKSAQRESNPHFRHGKAIGYRYIMGAFVGFELSKIKGAPDHPPGGARTRTHVAAVRERSLRR